MIEQAADFVLSKIYLYVGIQHISNYFDFKYSLENVFLRDVDLLEEQPKVLLSVPVLIKGIIEFEL